MDFMSRGPRPASPVQTGNINNQNASQQAGAPRDEKKHGKFDFLRISSITLLFCIVVLIIAILVSLIWGGSRSEARYVNGKEMQAVFLNGGQVYFGHIKSLNGNYIRLTDIFYLRVNQQVQPSKAQADTNANGDVSLVKLGCELHGPVDEMLLNRDQVQFWENLKNDGQVAKAVANYDKQNPDGQKCNQQATSQSTSTTTTTDSNKKQ